MDIRYSAFASYSGVDNTSTYGWIEQCCEQLDRVLQARLRLKPARPLHQYRRNGATHGSLPERMKDSIRRSPAMLIFVHEHFGSSEECLDELRHFRSIFGEQGLRERLFIVAMSRPATEAFVRSDFWTEEIKLPKPVWIDFSRQDDNDKPLPIAANNSPFTNTQFNDQLDKVVKLIVSCNQLPPPDDARIATEAAAPTRWAFGVARAELDAEVRALADRVSRHTGQPARLLKHEDVLLGMKLDDIDTLVLPLNSGKPLLPMLTGGHLAVQSKAWLDAGKPKERLLWLDLRHIAAGEPASEAEAAHAMELARGHLLRPDQLLGQLVDGPDDEQAIIYIESNAREINHWDVLGQKIRERWRVIAQGLAPPILLSHFALPVDKLDEVRSIDDADGVMVLWGRKDSDSLFDQIKKVQKRLPGYRSGEALPPRRVAYLMPPNDQPAEIVPARGWTVLRFNATTRALPDGDGSAGRLGLAANQPFDMLSDIDVAKEEAALLDAFLHDIMKRAQARRRTPGAAAA